MDAERDGSKHGGGRVTLGEAQQALTRTRVLTAARSVLVARGLAATIDDVAEAAGLSARTIYRHFGSHSGLVTEAIRGIYEDLGRPVEGLPDADADLAEFLHPLVLAAHVRNAELLGRLVFDLIGGAGEGVLGEGLDIRQQARHRWMGWIVRKAWHAAGGAGTPPDHVTAAFWLLFSGPSTRYLETEYDWAPEEAAATTTAILLSLVSGAVAEQRAAVPS